MGATLRIHARMVPTMGKTRPYSTSVAMARLLAWGGGGLGSVGRAPGCVGRWLPVGVYVGRGVKWAAVGVNHVGGVRLWHGSRAGAHIFGSIAFDGPGKRKIAWAVPLNQINQSIKSSRQHGIKKKGKRQSAWSG